jgi:hypothetical protein
MAWASAGSDPNRRTRPKAIRVEVAFMGNPISGRPYRITSRAAHHVAYHAMLTELSEITQMGTTEASEVD